MELKENNESLECYKKSFKISKQTIGKDHLSLSITYHNFGYTYLKAGAYNTSLEYYEKSLNILNKTLGENHPETASTLNHMCFCFKKIGEQRSAEIL